jgi:tetratricopeptide (TPR) repeat protein
MRLFKEQKYAEARKRLDSLLTSHPRSATALALRGDATLFDESLDYEDAARESLRYYEPASRLVDGGCEVRRRSEYYLRMGEAYAALRLRDPERAFLALSKAERKWPISAEVHYNLARVRCGRVDKLDAAESSRSATARADAEPGDARKRELDACVEAFERALTLAESPERPLFFRTHRSAEDWIVRSEKQSEFSPLRRDERYGSIIRRARERATTDVGGSD